MDFLGTDIINQVVQISSSLVLVPFLVIPLNEGLKRMGMPNRFSILVNWILGIGTALVFTPAGTSLAVKVVSGFIAGSAASGIYDGARKLVIPAAKNAVDVIPELPKEKKKKARKKKRKKA